MKGVFYQIENGKIFLTLSKQFFERSAIYAASYEMTDKYSIMIKPASEREISIILEPKKDQSVHEMETAIFDFYDKVLDHQIRLDLEKQYGKLRELIVEHAFSPLSDLKNKLEQIK